MGLALLIARYCLMQINRIDETCRHWFCLASLISGLSFVIHGLRPFNGGPIPSSIPLSKEAHLFIGLLRRLPSKKYFCLVTSYSAPYQFDLRKCKFLILSSSYFDSNSRYCTTYHSFLYCHFPWFSLSSFLYSHYGFLQ